MGIKRAVAAAVLVAGSFLAGPAGAAKGFNYSYADVGYLRQNIDTSGTGFNFAHEDGIQVDGVFGVHDYVSLRGRFMRGRVDLSGATIDETLFAGGLLAHYPVIDRLDVFADFLYFNSKLNSNSASTTDLGVDYSLGVRFRVIKRLEIDAAYRRIGGDTDEGFGNVAAIVKLTKKLDFVAKGDFGTDEDELYFAGVRLNF